MDRTSDYVIQDELENLTDEGTIVGQLLCGVDVGLRGFSAIAIVTHDGKVLSISRESDSNVGK